MRFQKRFRLSAAALAAAVMIATPANAGVWGSPKFKINQSDDRFRADDTTIVSSEGNRISKKSIAGGVHIDKQGVFLNPAVMMKRGTHEVVSLYFDLFNVTERMGGIGAPNSVGRPIRISFLTGEGSPIILDVRNGEQSYGEPQCVQFTVGGCSTSLIEGGIVPISIEQYRRLLAATALAIKLDGSERSHVYETSDVAPTFIENLRAFHASYLTSAQ